MSSAIVQMCFFTFSPLFRGMSRVQVQLFKVVPVPRRVVQIYHLCPVSCSKECLMFGTVVQRYVFCPVIV